MQVSNEPYYGRSLDGHEPFQLLIDHLTETSELMEEYCSKFTCPEIGRVCGLLHDIGKYSPEFQRRVRGDSIHVDHATAGAFVAQKIAETEPIVSKIAYSLLSYVIAGHHTGLPNMGSVNSSLSDLCLRLKNCDPERFSAWEREVAHPNVHLDSFLCGRHYSDRRMMGFSLFLYTHFLFSCLVDADRTSAQRFSGTLPTQDYPPLFVYQSMLNEYMKRNFPKKTDKLNTLRNEIFQNCLKKSKDKRGIFTLTVPTGGGKTLSSLSFALNHAITNGMNRIIYTIPFTSIIEQNAEVYKSIFGNENVIEHHSNFILPSSWTYECDDPENETKKLVFAVSNWNAPLILTTNIQFFESLFTDNPSRSRKVHNIENSVIILDEVQALPNELLRPCMFALTELVEQYHCSVVLCTATQPEFQENGILPSVPITPIVENYQELYQKMKRVTCTVLGTKTLDEIATEIKKERQCLCIVNTKRHARDLYARINESGNCFHLSTNMYPAHRKEVIKTIRKRLDEGKPCRVISTQLIEAGVDIDFPVVYRSLAGIDALLQAAGRCNREGNDQRGRFYVFKPSEPEYEGPDYLKLTAGITNSLKVDDYLSLDATRQYFRELFSIRSEKMDKPDVLKQCENAVTRIPPSYAFKNIANTFKMISDEGFAVVIPREIECKKLLSQISEKNVAFMQRQLSPYCVNVRKSVLDELYNKGQIMVVAETFVVLQNIEIYDLSTGLFFETAESDYIL